MSPSLRQQVTSDTVVQPKGHLFFCGPQSKHSVLFQYSLIPLEGTFNVKYSSLV